MTLFQTIRAFLFGTRYVAYNEYEFINNFRIGQVYTTKAGETFVRFPFRDLYLDPSLEGKKWFYIN